MMDAFLTPNASLWSLFASSFLAATLLPGGSELVLVGVLKMHPQLYWPALVIGTVGNTLGGLSSYLIGRIFPKPDTHNHGLQYVQKFGSASLLFAWAPIIGDALCVAAGWLRLNWLWVTVFMAIGKFLRYLLIAYPIHAGML
jgi:membrane protein YqaA with SNARE-associated domain